MLQSHIILSLGWALYCTVHSITAAQWFKEAAKKWMGKQFNFYRIYYGVFASLSLLAMLVLLLNTKSQALFKPGALSYMVGLSITLAGLAVMGICIAKYFNQLSGIRKLAKNSLSNQLMITGIHKWVRHPLYSGTFIFIWGLLILFPCVSGLLSDVIITIYTMIGLRFEEQKLEKEFGEAYKLYKKRVPMLLPRIG